MPDKESPQTQTLVVSMRVRPMNAVELQVLGCTEIVHVLDENLVVLRDPYEDVDDILRANRSREKQYIFDHAFGPNSTQMDVYSMTTKPLIENVITGYNATVFAYGATGAGKTYTMLGTDKEIGIMGLTLNDLFNQMNEGSEEITYKVTMSYLEIYNEMIRDLLSPQSGFLELREDSKGVNVAGISEIEAKTTKEVMSMLQQGNKQRTSEPTAANKTSSRSHAILQVTVTQESRVKNVMQEFRVGKLFMIDLAGSERAAQTKNRGKRMIEGAHINRSLLALGNCINALSENRNHYVNYRDSKLTRLLKDSLGGNCRTVMIAHVSPASRGFEESRNTLLYADRAKSIKTKVKRNQFNVSYHIAQYTNIIADLRKEIFRLKTKIAEQTFSNRELGTEGGKTTAKQKNVKQKEQDHAEMTKLRNELVSTFQDQMEIRRKLMELEDTAMQIALDTNRYMLTIDEWDQEKARRTVKNAAALREKERRALESSQTESSIDSLESTHIDKNGKEVWDSNKGRKMDWESEHGKEEGEWTEDSGSVEDVETKDMGNEKCTKKRESLTHEELYSMAEPEEVTFAREEINNLIAEEKRVSELKTELQAQLLNTRQEVERLEELLPQKISSEENREILGLICKVHELEISNAELQSQSLLRENLLRYKDLEVSKHESRQRLCDEIIRLQHDVITDAQVNCPAELETLYDVYLQQMTDLEDRESLGREGTNSSLNNSSVSLSKAAVLAGINRRMISRENLFTFSSKLSPLTEETPSRLVSLQNSPVKMLRASLSAQTAFAADSIMETSSPPPALPSPKRKSRIPSPDDVSLGLHSPTPSPTEDEPVHTVTTPEKPPTPEVRPPTPVFSKTQKIAEIAARRRILMDKSITSSRGNLKTNEEVSPSKTSSLISVRESRDREQPMASTSDSNMAAANEKTTGNNVKASLSLGDLSAIDKRGGDASLESGSVVVRRKRATKPSKVMERNKRYTPTKHKRLRSASLDESKVLRVKPRRTRKEELQEAARRGTGPYQSPGRHSVTLDGKSPTIRQTKRSRIPRPPPVQSTEFHRGFGRGGRESVKPRDSSTEPDGDLISFTSNATPPATVHQFNAHGKGLTIQKRYRAPSEFTGSDSNRSTPRLKPRKAQGNHSVNQPINELTISGFAVKPVKQYAGVRKF